ncbi:MAG TPA: hypothetical protein VF956_10280 [Candidatus Dormibacteraeota bacterium]
MSPAERYGAIVKAFAGKRGVSAESGRGFGSSALKIDNRIFAMLALGDQFVVKLPRQRVDALVDAGEGERFDPRRNGKLMKEWLVVGPRLENRWLPLAREAFDFAQAEKSKRA